MARIAGQQSGILREGDAFGEAGLLDGAPRNATVRASVRIGAPNPSNTRDPRKWRPVSFEDLVGQEHVVQTLKNAIRLGRVSHAYLFSGARGVGKTSVARILAKAQHR